MSENKDYVSRSDELGNIHISEEVLAAIAAAVACTESGAVVRSIRRAPAPAGSTPRRGAWGQAGLNAATRPFLS